MNIRPDIEEFIARLEIYANQKLNFPEEVGALLYIAMQSGRTDEFEELCFQSKFLVKTNEIMKRIGPGADGFEKLSAESQLRVQKARDIFHNLVRESPSEITANSTVSFLNIQTDSFQRFINLLIDLSWIKNWQVDGNSLPYEKKAANEMSLNESTSEDRRGKKTSEPIVQIKRSALMSIILLAVFLFLDSPITTFGWILLLGIAAFLVYILLQAHIMTRTPRS
jgi:hypothetical protein